MARKLYLVAGIVLAISSFPTLVVVPDLSPVEVFANVLTGVGGLLFVAAATEPAVDIGSRTAQWFHFAGGGDVAIGIGLPLSLAASSDDTVLVVAAAVAGLVLVIIGLDMLRGGEYVDISGR